MRTSFHHQPEAQHPKSPAIYTPAGRLPHLCADSDHSRHESKLTLCARSRRTAELERGAGQWSVSAAPFQVFHQQQTFASASYTPRPNGGYCGPVS